MLSLKARLRTFGKGDYVRLAKSDGYTGRIVQYLGYTLTPKKRGRKYVVKWKEQSGEWSESIHFDTDLVLVRRK